MASDGMTECYVCGTPIPRSVGEVDDLPPGLPDRPVRRYCSGDCPRRTNDGYDEAGYKPFIAAAYCGRGWPIAKIDRAIEPSEQTLTKWLRDWGWYERSETDLDRGGSVREPMSPRGRIARAIVALHTRGRTLVDAQVIANGLAGIHPHHVGWYLQDVDDGGEFGDELETVYGIRVEPYGTEGESKGYRLVDVQRQGRPPRRGATSDD